jgi:hypothetical protein
MFKGLVIDELVEMVERAEDHAHSAQPPLEEQLLHFAYRPTESQATMIGVA